MIAQLAGAVECTDITSAEEQPHQRESLIWHKIIWWWGSSNTGALGNGQYPFIARRSTLSGVVATYSVLSMGQIELNSVFMLNWNAWNRTVLICKLHNYAKLNYLKQNSFGILNQIALHRTVLTFNWVWTKTILILN